MGPIAHYLGGPNANQPKTFAIRWPDEVGHNKAPIALEIIEKPGAKSNHKVIKASQLRSNLKVSYYPNLYASL